MLHPRQSYYPSAASQQQQQHLLSSLHSCISSTSSCVETLQSSITTLDQATFDFSRLNVILSNQRHFDLISERDIDHARSHLSAEVLPHINELIIRANTEIERQERRLVALKNKAAAQNQRLQNLHSIDQLHSKKGFKETVIQEQREKLETLRNKKDQLAKQIEQMEQQV